ncbi:MAG: SIMPL domain-containing protein [Chloroflexota bacterium]
MKIRVTLAIGATIAAAALFAACGGGSSDPATSNQSSSKITTQHGLAVAAIYGNGASNVGGTGNNGDKSVPTAAPAENASSVSSDSAARSASGVGSSSSSGIAAPQAIGDGTTGITVSGFGLATADPDAAIIDFYFSRYGGYCCVSPLPAPDLPADGSSGSGSAPAPPIDIKPTTGAGETVEPITEAVLQPVIDAIVAAGVSRSDIEFINSYSDQYSSSATLHVTVKNIDSVSDVTTAAQNAANNLGGNTSFSSNVSYTLQDCSAIEKAALDAAVTDAGERGQQLATALHVGLGKVIGAADYSYSPSGSQCSSGGMPYPVYYDVGVKSATGGATSVQVVAQISVTYAMN